MIARRPMLLVGAGCVVATAVGLVLGQGGTVALAAALVLAAALAAATALELRPARRRQQSPRARADELPLPLPLRQIVDVLRESERSEYSVDRSLRPLLVPIVAARLGRRGIDMTLAPRRAHELLGDQLWEIVRPDRPSATSRVSRGVAGDDLQEAIERLERI